MLVEKVLEYNVYLVVTFFLVYLILNCFGIPKSKKRIKEKSLLYYPTITENGIKARDVFQSLAQNNIKPNYLGMED